MQQLWLLSGTAALTLLIWVSADQLATKKVEMSVRIVVRAEPNSNLIIKSMEDASQRYLVTLSGRQSDVSRLGDLGARDIVITIKDSTVSGQGLGQQTLSLLEELQARQSDFAGCTALHVEPATIQIKVDRRIEREVSIHAHLGNLDYSVEPRVDPATARVTVLQTEWDRIKNANPRIVLDAVSDMGNQPEGEPIRLEVPLVSVIKNDGSDVAALSVIPKTVTLRATLRRRRKAGTIQAVPVKFLVSQSVWNRYDVQFRQANPPETLRVHVVGPPDEVDKLVGGQRKTFAVITVGSPDSMPDGSFQFFKPEFNLPPGVKLADDQVTESFEIRMVRRAEPASDPDRGN